MIAFRYAGCAAFAGAAMFVANAAQADLVKCEFESSGPYRGTPSVVLVKAEPGDKVASVYDSLMKHYEIDPVFGKVREFSKTKLVVKWELKNVQFSKTFSGTIRYRMYWDRKNKNAHVTGLVLGDDVDRKGRGNCKIIESS